jgi:hypothetical protein
MADSNTKYTYVLEAVRADGKKVMRFTNKPENRAQVLINNGYKPIDEDHKVEFIKINSPMTKSEYKDSLTNPVQGPVKAEAKATA